MTFNNIVILLTPFHKIAIEKCLPELINEEDTLILHSELISPQSKGNLVRIPNLKAKDFLRKPFTTYVKFKKYLKYCRNISTEFISSCAAENIKLVLGTEKDTFTQVFLNELYKTRQTVELIFVEEGIGYYKKEPKLSLKPIYNITTKLLFCQKIQRVDVLGTDKRANKVFCRFPEYIKKKPFVIYEKFCLTSKRYNKAQAKNEMIIFTVPPQDHGITNTAAIDLIEKIAVNNVEYDCIVIKPHPRDNTNYDLLISKKIKTINKHLTAENLNFNNYGLVVHFNSSIIFYLLEINFPKNKIISILPKNERTIFNENTKQLFVNYLPKNYDKIANYITNQTN